MECQRCGAKIFPEWRKCGQCGHPVNERAQVDPKDQGSPLRALRILGGTGESFETAISIKGVYDSANGINVEYFILKKMFGRPGHDWALQRQNLHKRGDLSYDIMRLRLRDGRDVTVYFEITDFFKTIREMVRKAQKDPKNADVRTDSSEGSDE